MHPLLNPKTKLQVKKFLDKPAHALGLEGAEGTGKYFLAQHLCTMLLGAKSSENHPYAMLIDSADLSDSGIEKIREVKKFLQLKVPGDKTIKRCVMLGSIEKLSSSAQNALLKTLEEPPDDTVIIVTANNKHNLLPTTVSRLQWIRVLPIDKAVLIDKFSDSYDKANIERAYYLSEGNIGLFYEILKNETKHTSVSAITEAKTLLNSSKLQRMSVIDKISKSDDLSIESLLDALHKIFHAAIRAEIDKQGTAKPNLLKKLEAINTAKSSLRYNANNKLLLTNLFYQL